VQSHISVLLFVDIPCCHLEEHQKGYFKQWYWHTPEKHRAEVWQLMLYKQLLLYKQQVSVWQSNVLVHFGCFHFKVIEHQLLSRQSCVGWVWKDSFLTFSNYSLYIMFMEQLQKKNDLAPRCKCSECFDP
jgi:hypothetical protein